MFRARERGMSFWPFAISLLGLVVFIILWFSATSERDNANRSAATAENNRKLMEQEKDDANKRLLAASKEIGFTTGGNFSDPAEIQRQLKEYGLKLADTLTIEFPEDRYQQSGDGGVVEKAEGGKVKVRYLTEADLADVPTAQGFLSKFETASKRMKFDIDRAFNAQSQAYTEKETVVKTGQETMKQKDARIAELTGEKAALDNQMREKEQELKEQIAQLTSQKDSKDTELETLRKQASENEAKLIAQLNEARATVKTLVQRDAPAQSEGPDGEVVVADAGVAIINRGKAQWLQPGTTFDVWGLAKGGAKYRKGSIKVTSCDDETARAAVLEESARDPIAKGDLIQSLTYSPSRQIHFALVGDFKKMGRSQAEAVLKKLGAAVDSRVTAETNYLVVGVPAAGQESLDDTDAVKTAKDLGIRMITEEQLALFTRY
jgi:BRCA1 C Terminus (BRCT) domain